MTTLTEKTRAKALSILEKAGIKYRRIGSGQRYVYHLENEATGQKWRALMKIGSYGGVIARPDSGDPDTANLSGFGPDVDTVMFAVGSRGSDEVDVYLVPIEEAEKAYRDNQREWLASHPETTDNKTWVLRDFDQWADRLVHPHPPEVEIEAFKAMLASLHGVSPDRVRISIEL